MSEGSGGNAETTAPDAADQIPEAPQTFSQRQVDKIVGERLAREREKFADYEELTKKASEFDKLAEARKSDIDKANEARTAAEQRAATFEQQNRELRLASAVSDVAVTRGAIDPSAVVAMIDRSRIDYDKAGNARNLDVLVEELLQAKPYLVGQTAGPTPRTGGFDGGARQDAPGGHGDMNARLRRAAGRS